MRFLVLVALTWSSAACAARTRSRPCMPEVVRVLPASRWLPHAAHDQTTASLLAMHPALEVLTSRRTAMLPGVTYSLLAFKTRPASDAIHVSAIGIPAVGDSAWMIEAECAAGDLRLALDRTMDLLGRIPATP
jgi:hypothetical protein